MTYRYRVSALVAMTNESVPGADRAFVHLSAEQPRSYRVPASDEVRTRAIEVVHSRICEESLSEHLDPEWPGRCARAIDELIAADLIRGGS